MSPEQATEMLRLLSQIHAVVGISFGMGIVWFCVSIWRAMK